MVLLQTVFGQRIRGEERRNKIFGKNSRFGKSSADE
jgi:hypothetical protein